ncbi:CHAT domain-containing protein [Dolichospermum lemmermannii CS-548]|uniref:CHAT domain-containing protein n=1 Tax=Dolichospermum lemmermannii TaxID=54295 RepID=UPI00232D9E1A|nr:CHAT domain-containing protein [Dolichospermum lemmermannii]MDB9435929.1 CHAT domain-containing protein [Dolichospermum lemmermannii CS-548]
MGINPIQQLKNNQSSFNYQLQSQAKSADKLLENNNNSEIDEIERLSKENNKDFQTIFRIKIDQKFKEQVATLEVNLEDDDSIHIRFCHALFEPGGQVIKITDAPEISFDKMMRSVKDNTTLVNKSRDFIGTMRQLSKKNGKASQLTSCLRTLQKKLQDEFQHQLSYLIIYDLTTFEIPWEMLEIKKDEYLGASIVTVRWQDIIDQNDWDNENRLINLEIEENNCRGKMVAYLNKNLNKKDPNEVNLEKQTIEKFQPILHDNINEFLLFLNSSKPNISLIFIASHGFYEDDESTKINDSTIRLGANDPKEQISLSGLSAYNFNCLTEISIIVFINACHSGRLHKNDPLRIKESKIFSGFPIFFLEKGAKGVIGTLYKVKNEYAVIFSQNFFAEYEANNGLSVAKILKNIREKAVKEYINNPDTKNMLLFFYTFMYIYYGNPMTTLDIIPHEEN